MAQLIKLKWGWLLSVCMAIVFLSFAFLHENRIYAEEDIIASGYGWVIYQNGDMYFSSYNCLREDYDKEKPPWYQYRDHIQTLRIDPAGLVVYFGIDYADKIGNYAFSDCKNLREVIWPTILGSDGITNLTKCVGKRAFANCSQLRSFPFAKIGIIKEGAFYGCNSIEKVTLDGNFNIFEDHAFQNCTSLQSVIITKGTSTFKNGEYINTHVRVIPEGAFENCRSLTYIEIPYYFSGISAYAFRDCVSLMEIELPAKLYSIQAFAFSGCTSLAVLNIPGSVGHLGKFSLSCPESVIIVCQMNWDCECEYPLCGFETVNNRIFCWKDNRDAIYNALSREHIRLLDLDLYRPSKHPVTQPTTIPTTATTTTTTTTSTITKDNTITSFSATSRTTTVATTPYDTLPTKGKCGENDDPVIWKLDIDGILVISGRGAMKEYEKEKAPWFRYKEYISEVFIKENVTKIGNAAFYGCDKVRSVTIPSTIVSIGNDAFNGCSSLYQVDLPNEILTIEANAFYDCTSLTKITLPKHLKTIGYGAFRNCIALSECDFPEGVETIKATAFYQCDSLVEIVLPKSVHTIEDEAFGQKIFMTAPIPKTFKILNPQCRIAQQMNTFGQGDIYGYSGSTAEAYANTFYKPGHFICIDDSVLGDLNGDGQVTVSDAILLARIVAEDSSLKVNSQMLAAADYDKDGSITPLDTSALLKVLAGIA
jgi:hypothetical protein